MDYDIIIGLEIHAELKTKSKMFCACDNDSRGKEPNTVVCPVCMAHPGTLPIPNKQAIEWTLLLGLALNGKVNGLSKFDRKNYFYPDLPKGYQISQFDLPFIYGAHIDIDDEKIEITRIHLEEDTGKLMHPAGKGHTLVDLNRAGTPLIEMVTEPIIHSAEMAKKFATVYQQVLRYLDISNADMEKGEMRCEANISAQEKGKWERDGKGGIRPKGDYKLNPKVEVKNINSFRAMERAIEYEIKRQVKAIKDGDKLTQETRGWDEKNQATFSQRAKETSADYRYFPEPDIPPIRIGAEWIEKIKSGLIEMPMKKKKRFIAEYDLTPESAEILSGDKDLAAYAEEVISELRAWIIAEGDTWERQKKKLAKITANWLTSELFKHLKEGNISVKDLKITPENFAELLTLVYLDKISSSAAQKILHTMYNKGGDPTDIMAELGLEQMDDDEALRSAVETVIIKNAKQVADYKAGKEGVLQFLIGQVMSATKGKANPKLVLKILKELLSE